MQPPLPPRLSPMLPDALDTDQTPAPQSLLGDAVPMVVSRLGLALMGLTDIILLSRHDPMELAKATLLESTFGRGLDIAIAFIVSALPLAAFAFSKGGMPPAWAIWRRSMAGAGLLGLALLMLAPFAAELLTALGQPQRLIPGTAALFPVAATGGVFGLLAIACAVGLEGTGRAPTVTWAVLAANLANLLLDLWLIGGGFGLAPMGAMGAVTATAIVRAGLFFALALMLHRHARSMASAPSDESSADPGMQRQLFAGGAAMGIAATMHVFGMVLTMTAGWLGSSPLAIYSACWALNLPMMIIVSGLGDTLAMRVGRNPAHAVMPDLARLAMLVTLPALALGLAAPWVADLYTDDAKIGVMLSQLLPFSASVMWLDALSLLLLNVMRGRQVFTAPAIIQIVSMALAVPLGWWLAIAQDIGLAGIVYAILATSALRLAAMALCLMLTASRPTALRPSAAT